MRKVKLVFVKSFVEIPTIKDTFDANVEVLVPDGFHNMRLIGARVYEGDPDKAKDSNFELPGGDHNTLVVDTRDFSSLLGKLLTYVDATFSDQEQRKAHKDIVKNILWDFEGDLRTRAVQTVDSNVTGGQINRMPSFTETRTIGGQTMGNDDKGESVLAPKDSNQ